MQKGDIAAFFVTKFSYIFIVTHCFPFSMVI